MASVTYRLSSVDQSRSRSYSESPFVSPKLCAQSYADARSVRCCYCFSLDGKGSVSDVVRSLSTSTQRAVNRFPILGGTIAENSATKTMPVYTPLHNPDNHRPNWRRDLSGQEGTGGNTFALLEASDVDDEVSQLNKNTTQRGRVDVLARLDCEPFQPVIKHWASDDCPKSYDELAAEGMPSGAFIAGFLAPEPVQGDNPAFTVHANFLSGGVLVVISLHHSVADVHGLAAVVRCMSIDHMSPSSKELSLQTLQTDAQQQPRIRDRLSGSRGVKPSHFGYADWEKLNRSSPERCRILTFDLGRVLEVTEMVNKRAALSFAQPFATVRPIECLIAMLWKALTRARRLRASEHQSKLSVEVDMRMHLSLDHDYIGNACHLAEVQAPALQLNLPFDVGTLSNISQTVHNMMAVPEVQMRSAIAAVNEAPVVRSLSRNTVPSDADVLITDWSGLPTDGEATMGLGLGNCQFVSRREPTLVLLQCANPSAQVRHVLSDQPVDGCTIMPQRPEAGAWEVAVHYDNETMAHLLDEEVGIPFVRRIV